MSTQTKQSLSTMTPEKALNLLKEGNRRFIEGRPLDRNLLEQTKETYANQYPFAVILGCIDSRAPLELVFDQGIGDIFGVRIAGNFVNKDILGSMEFATKVVGSKHILVLGHTNCGAIQGANDLVELGNLTGLLHKLQPAVEAVKKKQGQNPDIDDIARENVLFTVEEIKSRSKIIRDLVNEGQLAISGAMYDVANGEVTFL
ncbi:MAG: carbonic anhydrase family protein [Anaerolineales bacterium]